MKLKEAIPGFEPGSPDSKSGVINHYTKSPGTSGLRSFTVIYYCQILEIFNTSHICQFGSMRYNKCTLDLTHGLFIQIHSS